jgi:DNA-directed RNA polymerase subunit RPC12/RpoP
MRFSKPIDVVHMYCQACGQRVDCSNWDEEVGIACPACGMGVRVPGYLRGAVRRVEEEPNELARYERELDEILPDERIDLTDKAAMSANRSRRIARWCRSSGTS